ncbi:MAG: hypothetical protein R3E91_05355 [Chlamydiales bacterium]
MEFTNHIQSVKFEQYDHSSKEDHTGQLNITSFVRINQRIHSSKKWAIVAIVVGTFFLTAIGGFGVVGLLQSHGLIALPHSLQWLASAIGTISQTTHFWGLWTVVGSGLLIGTSLITCGILRIKKSLLSLVLDDFSKSNEITDLMTWALQAPLHWCVRTFFSIFYAINPYSSVVG